MSAGYDTTEYGCLEFVSAVGSSAWNTAMIVGVAVGGDHRSVLVDDHALLGLVAEVFRSEHEAASGALLGRVSHVGVLALAQVVVADRLPGVCLLYTSPSPRDRQKSRMPSSA